MVAKRTPIVSQTDLQYIVLVMAGFASLVLTYYVGTFSVPLIPWPSLPDNAFVDGQLTDAARATMDRWNLINIFIATITGIVVSCAVLVGTYFVMKRLKFSVSLNRLFWALLFLVLLLAGFMAWILNAPTSNEPNISAIQELLQVGLAGSLIAVSWLIAGRIAPVVTKRGKRA